MDAEPLILLVGDDTVTERVCAELTATAGHRVCVAGQLGPERQAAFRLLGATVAVGAIDADEALIAAGVLDAASLLAPYRCISSGPLAEASYLL